MGIRIDHTSPAALSSGQRRLRPLTRRLAALTAALLLVQQATPAAAVDVQQISGRIFLDLNRNGRLDAGEPGLENVQLRIYTGGVKPWEAFGYSRAQGEYDFGGLTPSHYHVSVLLPTGWQATSPPDILVDVREEQPSATGVNFGLVSADTPAPPAIPASTAPAQDAASEPGALDFAVSGGRFYKQANGLGGSGDRGFSILDGGRDSQGNDIRLYTGYQALGGEGLGYVISRRFRLNAGDPSVYQLTQKVLLQWDPARGTVVVPNLFDILNQAGLDRALANLGYPAAEADEGTDFAMARALRLGWLNDPAFADFRALYQQSPDPEGLYGLPAARPQEFAGQRVLRLQRAAFVAPQGSPPFLAYAGDAAKLTGYFSGVMLVPHASDAAAQLEPMTRGETAAAPTPAPAPATVAPPRLVRLDYRVEWVEGITNCNDTVLGGVVRDVSGEPRNDEWVKTWNDWGNEVLIQVGSGPRDVGDWDRMIGRGIQPGVWHAAIVDRASGALKSNVSTVRFTESCADGGVQHVRIHFRENPGSP